MKVAIVIHTQSGHTTQFARAIASKFNQNGHECDVMLLRTTGQVSPGSRKFTIKNPPEIYGYDAALFGGPVWAFSASPVIKSYLGQLKNLKCKKVMSIATKGLPFSWTGGSRALKQMDQELEASGGTVLPGEVLHFFFKANQKKMNSAVERIFKAFTD
ncbi:MAG: flavodoxin family protein [Fibrobacter sp.]|nr:flavodoxin family protein [Fibrobacter sp.]